MFDDALMEANRVLCHSGHDHVLRANGMVVFISLFLAAIANSLRRVNHCTEPSA